MSKVLNFLLQGKKSFTHSFMPFVFKKFKLDIFKTVLEIFKRCLKI